MHTVIISDEQRRIGFTIWRNGAWVAVPYTIISSLPGGMYLAEDPAYMGRLESE